MNGNGGKEQRRVAGGCGYFWGAARHSSVGELTLGVGSSRQGRLGRQIAQRRRGGAAGTQGVLQCSRQHNRATLTSAHALAVTVSSPPFSPAPSTTRARNVLLATGPPAALFAPDPPGARVRPTPPSPTYLPTFLHPKLAALPRLVLSCLPTPLSTTTLARSLPPTQQALGSPFSFCLSVDGSSPVNRLSIASPGGVVGAHPLTSRRPTSPRLFPRQAARRSTYPPTFLTLAHERFILLSREPTGGITPRVSISCKRGGRIDGAVHRLLGPRRVP